MLCARPVGCSASLGGAQDGTRSYGDRRAPKLAHEGVYRGSDDRERDGRCPGRTLCVRLAFDLRLQRRMPGAVHKAEHKSDGAAARSRTEATEYSLAAVRGAGWEACKRAGEGSKRVVRLVDDSRTSELAVADDDLDAQVVRVHLDDAQ